ncbi:histidine phosphatase family protein [Aeromicrobium duanguangcaii]|uniref:Histidine phosphatase family protein n=1 Tax=Aeromicrobium duanguangcaii TaxID=2968086 RepID=A0ABY5KBM1_9ACTN|nr:histidine phosphatase family protein [Aeromicrobium duanguangcaii]MCD9154722.1 histidine phosphatase family protein [Aeromicrobium duanguangcaii]MCL3838844.1 histidine phosphatase family protein [Aeromicrobium duanguangcaii]UUI67864.1 histidine phosphatase family protein [Aeromicrobium duanguangcaii]
MEQTVGETELWLVRHGETEWSRTWRHTSFTDLELTETGRAQARALRPLLSGVGFNRVWSSPRRRALETAHLAGFDPEIVEDVVEWHYGEYEGVTTEEIRETVPGWTVWTHPSPLGESPEQVAERLDRVVDRARSLGGRTLVFAHGHSLRVLAARWLGLEVADGRVFLLDTGTYSVLGDDRGQPVVIRWNVREEAEEDRP